MTDVLPVRVNLVPSVDIQMEREFANWLSEAAKIVGRMKVEPHSNVITLLKKLKQLKPPLCEQEKDEVREELKKRYSTALKDGGIPPEITDTVTSVFVNQSMEDIKLVCAEHGESIVLYLKCLSLESLFKLKEMILYGSLSNLLSIAIHQFIPRQNKIEKVQLIVKGEDFSNCVSFFDSAASKRDFVICLIAIAYCVGQIIKPVELITNRKSYMGFRLVPKSVTLNNLEQRNGHYFALFRQIR